MTYDLRLTSKKQFSPRLNRSKSLFIRYLIHDFLRHNIIHPVDSNEPDDIKVVQSALGSIKYAHLNPGVTIINVCDCGTAYRFLLSVLATTHGEWLLTGSSRLLQRPIKPLVDALVAIGAEIQQTPKGIFIRGKCLSAEEVAIDTTLSGQFASSIMLIFSRINLKRLSMIPNPPPSLPYIHMTHKIFNVLESIPIDVESIENDWSGAAFWYAFVGLKEGSSAFLNNLKLDSLQGDVVVAEWFSKLGVTTEEKENGLLISNSPSDHSELFSFDLTNHPDLAPILSFFALLKQINIQLKGINNLNYKESNRLEIIKNTLLPYCKIDSKENEITIYPFSKPENQQLSFDAHNDHRFVMAFLLFACFNEVTISDINSVNKSYPNFLGDIEEIKKEK